MKNGIFDTSSVIYLKNKNIDRAKWDECINTASNGLIYGCSFYLDAMAKNWDALVMNDYEAVMPLTWNKKYGIYYLYQPFTCAALGVFGKPIQANLTNMFLNNIPGKFKYWDIYLNTTKLLPAKHFAISKRINYTLNLNQPYPILFNNYRSSYKQILKKSTANQLEIKQNINVEEITSLTQQTLEKVSRTKAGDIYNFEQLYKLLFNKNKATNYGVYLNNKLLASGIFLFSHNRACYVLAGNTKEGRRLGASHIVIDNFIKQHAESRMLFDFEGSNVPGIAFFFKGFGAQPEEYTGIKYNALPSILRMFKK